MSYPWIERHHVFLHNWAEVEHFISELREEAEKAFTHQLKEPWISRRVDDAH